LNHAEFASPNNNINRSNLWSDYNDGYVPRGRATHRAISREVDVLDYFVRG